MNTYLVTGANGFIGYPLTVGLMEQGALVHGTVRNERSLTAAGVKKFVTGDIDAQTDWRKALEGVDVVFHLAGTVHRPDIQTSVIYQTAIPQASLALARQAAEARVKRFIYISTSHVYGVENSEHLIAESHSKCPLTFYGRAKLNAENALQAFWAQSTMEWVIVRPPLVYGKNVKGNMLHLMRLIQKVPILPFGKATNKRSYVGIDNLLSFLYVCVSHPQAARNIFNISDDQDLSTQELCKIFADLLGKKRLLLPILPSIMRMGLTLIGKQTLYSKLFGSVRLDISSAKNNLGWKPVCKSLFKSLSD